MRIVLSKITYQLPNANRPLFEIPRLELSGSEKILISGASGLGKTTLLHLIAGLLPPTAGQITFDEKNINYFSQPELSRLRREHFAIVFQKLNVLDFLTAEENILLGSEKPSLEKAHELLKTFDLLEKKGVFAKDLSLGQQQKVAIARAMMGKPSCVLADEPTSSLDDVNATQVLQGLLNIPGNPLVVVVSHDRRIEKHFDRVLRFEDWLPK